MLGGLYTSIAVAGRAEAARIFVFHPSILCGAVHSCVSLYNVQHGGVSSGSPSTKGCQQSRQ